MNTKETRDLQPGDTIYHPYRKPLKIVRVEIEPLPCVVAKVITENPADWFFSGVCGEHSIVPLDSTR